MQAAKILGVARSTFHRRLNAGLIAGEQLTPGAPWRLRITEQLRQAFGLSCKTLSFSTSCRLFRKHLPADCVGRGWTRNSA
jgi:hypothetical protein